MRRLVLAGITERQPAGVFFLSGNGSSTDEHVITFDCKVPAGSYLFTGLPETLCSNALPNAAGLNTPRKILACARDGWKAVGDHSPRLMLDGKALPPLAPGRHTLIEGVKYVNFHNQVLIWNLEVV